MNRTTAVILISTLLNISVGGHSIAHAADADTTAPPSSTQAAAIRTTPPVYAPGHAHHAAVQALITRQRAHAEAMRADIKARAAAQVKALRAQRDARLKALNPAAFARIKQHRAQAAAARAAMGFPSSD